VLPLDGRKAERLSAEWQGRPSPGRNRTTFTYYPGTLAVPVGSAPPVLNKSFTVTAEIDTDGDGPADGAIWSLGGSDGGFGLYVRHGCPVFVGNFLNRSHTRVTSPDPLPLGTVVLRAEFLYDGGGFGKGGRLSLSVDGQRTGEERMSQTHATTLGLGGTLDIGADTGTAVDPAYDPPFRYGGNIRRVTVELRP
jgi:arylsulfatase